MAPNRRVLIGAGHRIDDPGRDDPRFPPAAEAVVANRIASVLAGWGIGPGDVVITGGANGGDILISEAARRRGADIWLLLALDVGDHVEESVARPDGDWAARFEALRAAATVRFQAAELGAPRDGDDPFVRNNRWLVDAARREAGGAGLLAVVVWDGVADSVTGDFVERARAAGAELAVVVPPAAVAPEAAA